MGTSNLSPPCARFDRFHIDFSSGELLRSGVRVAIQEQPLQILRLLLEAEGKVVTREQLCAALWPKDTFVDFEHSVNTAVKKLRLALGDSAEHPKFIGTLPKLGYRFMVQVEWVADNPGETASTQIGRIPPPELAPQDPRPPPVKRHWKLTAAVALAALAVLASLIDLAEEQSYLSPTRVGTLARRAMRVASATTQQVVTERRLTANPEDAPITSAAISPDGKYLAYTDRTGFYLKQVESGETRPVPLPKGFDASVESWFPDSVHLVVSWVDDYKKPPSLWEISVMGGTPRQLAQEGSSASVSPDGSHIVFLAGMWDHEEVWQIEADGGSARKLLNGDKDDFGAVAWAPDGKRFAYVRTINPPGSEEPEKQAEVYELASGHSTVILSEHRLGNEISWITAGRLIYSLQEAPPNQSDFNLWALHLDSRTGRPSGPPTRITTEQSQIASLSVTNDGRRVALVRRAFQADVYLAELEAHGKRLSTPHRFTLDQRQDFPAAWTPDSKAVLIVSDRDGPLHIFKQDIDQTQPELLVGGKQDAWLPRLTPDGLSLLYLVSPEPGNSAGNVRLMRIPITGGPSQLVLEGPGIVNYQCARLPSTVCIYSQINPESYRFFNFEPSGGEVTEFLAAKTKRENGFNNWSLSPNGKHLVALPSQNPYKESQLRILSLEDNSTRYIPVPDVKLIVGMDWAANSKSVWVGGYMGRGSWGTHSGLVNVELTGKVTTFLEGSDPEVMGATPSPDGRGLAIGANTHSCNVWLLENF